MLIIAGALIALASNPAEARPHVHHHRHHHVHAARAHRAPAAHHRRSVDAVQEPPHNWFDRSPRTTSNARPRDCYGIAWCGCWLRHQFGIEDTRYNLAAFWKNFGHAVSGPIVGAIALIRRGGGIHHVGIVTGVDGNGNPIIKSGNHNNRVGTGTYPKHRVVGYRMQ